MRKGCTYTQHPRPVLSTRKQAKERYIKEREREINVHPQSSRRRCSSSITPFVCCLLSLNIRKRRMCSFLVGLLFIDDIAFFYLLSHSQTNIKMRQTHFLHNVGKFDYHSNKNPDLKITFVD